MLMQALVPFSIPHNHYGISRRKRITPSAITTEAYGIHEIRREQTEKHVSILQPWCHPSVRNTWESNFSQNGDVTTLFLAEISTISS